MERANPPRRGDVATDSTPPRKQPVHAAWRGTVAAMSMTGFREMTTSLGLVEETPPELVVHKQLPQIMRRFSPSTRAAVIVAAHWAYGAAGGIVFGTLPAQWRRTPLSGPLYGLVLWLGFDTVIAPVLGLRSLARKERGMLVADHLLYGMVLNELRTKPRH